jgi:hypothetical protein
VTLIPRQRLSNISDLDTDANNLNDTLKATAKNATEILPSTTSLPVRMPVPILSRSPVTAHSFISRHTGSASSSSTLVGSPATSPSIGALTPELYDRTFGRHDKTPTSSTVSLENQSLKWPDKPVEAVTIRISGLRRRLGPDRYKQRDFSHVVKIPGNTEMAYIRSWLQKEVTGALKS